MTPSGMVRTGFIGAIIAALCCATPILALALGGLGLGLLAARLDWFVIPALLGFLLLAGYGLYRQRRTAPCHAPREENQA